MSVTRRGFMVGVASLAASGWTRPAAAQSHTKVKFTLPWIPHGGYTHIFVAKKLGFWEKRGLDVSVDRGFGSGEVCKTIGLGQYDFGEIDMGVLVNCAAKQLDLMAIGNVSRARPSASSGRRGPASKGRRTSRARRWRSPRGAAISSSGPRS